MTGAELSIFICLRCDFCESVGCPREYCLKNYKCLHEFAYDMYILGLDMLETGDNPLI